MSSQCRLALATVLVFAAAVHTVSAQTVMVRNAPPGASIEVTMNSGTPATAKADGYGDATVAVPWSGSDTDVQLHVDNCGSTIRVQIAQPGQPAPSADPACTRKDMWGVYIMRSVTTFVVEISGSDSSVFVSQGPPPAAWLRRGASPTALPWGEASNGLFVSAGIGLSSFAEAMKSACGTATSCSHDGTGFAQQFGVEYWFAKYFAAHAAFLRPADVSAKGSGSSYRFDTSRVARVVMIGGKAGAPVGPGRIYAIAGANRHEATTTTNETVDPITVTVNNVTQTIAGGSQTFASKTEGWSWIFGGGYELWATKRVAVYAEFMRPKLKGATTNGADGATDEQGTVVVAGIRARVWR